MYRFSNIKLLAQNKVFKLSRVFTCTKCIYNIYQPCTQWKNEIVFSDINVSFDHAGCPPHICQICVSKLRRGIKIKNRKLRGNVSISWDMPKFQIPDHDSQKSDFDVLVETAKSVSGTYGFVTSSSKDFLAIVTLEAATGDVLLKLLVKQNLTWQLKYKQLSVPVSSSFLKDFSQELHPLELSRFLCTLSKLVLCEGQSSRDFPLLTKAMQADGKKELLGRTKEAVIGFYHENSYRHSKCGVLFFFN